MSHVVPIRPAALPAWRRLQSALEDAGPTACKDRDEWISEDLESRKYAVHRCVGCPVLLLCNEYATAAKEGAGVWGGRDRNAREQQIATLPLFENSADIATMRPVIVSTQGVNPMPRRNTPMARKRKEKPVSAAPWKPDAVTPEDLAKLLVQRGLRTRRILDSPSGTR